MKRTLSIIFIFAILLSVACLPANGAAVTKPAQVTQLKLTTKGTQRYLKLSWKTLDNVDGYQVFRSKSGKAKTYDKIATIRNAAKHSYGDQGLKSATTYYYKVRAFHKVGKKTLFGKFSVAVNLSTRMTKPAADKLYQKAYAVYHDWFLTTAYVREDSLADINDGYIGRVEHQTIKNKKQLKKYFAKYFTKNLYSEPLKYYWDYNTDDHLYTYYLGENPENPYIDYTSKSKIKNVQDTSFVYTRSGYLTNSNKKVVKTYALNYQNGKWLFDSGFSSAFADYYGTK